METTCHQSTSNRNWALLVPALQMITTTTVRKVLAPVESPTLLTSFCSKPLHENHPGYPSFSEVSKLFVRWAWVFIYSFSIHLAHAHTLEFSFWEKTIISAMWKCSIFNIRSGSAKLLFKGSLQQSLCRKYFKIDHFGIQFCWGRRRKNSRNQCCLPDKWPPL